jgi:hypothetical protein
VRQVRSQVRASPIMRWQGNECLRADWVTQTQKISALTSIVYSSQNVLGTEKLCPFSATYFRCDRKVNGLRSKSGSLAILAAILRA